MLVGDIVRLNARRLPGKEALVAGAERLTYAELDARADRLAAALLAAGVAPGDRVATLARNSAEHVCLYFATARLGALLVPLNFWHRADAHRYALEDSAPVLLCHEPEFDAVLDEAAAGLPLRRVRMRPLLEGAPAEPEWEELLAGAAGPAARPRPGDPHMILYTSGTTGLAKGAVLSHARTVEDAFAMAAALRLREDDTYVNYFPPFHVGNWDHMKLYLLLGARVVLLREFDPAVALATFERERASVVLGVPTMLHALLGDPAFERTDLSSIRLLYYGAYDPSGIMQRTAEAFRAREGRIELSHTYGLTEAGPFVALCQPQDVFRKWGSIGRAVPGVEIELQDADGRPVADGAPGEICVRGPRMTGYWRKPAETAEALEGGWLHTGDVAVRDEEGFLRIVDRKKDVIRSGGQNIFSKEVEDTLLGHASVADVAVIGVADAVYEEAVCALVVLAEGASGGEVLKAELQSFVRARVAGYNVPKRVEFVAELPKNAVGKTLKHVLREQYGSMFAAAAHGGAG